MTIKTYQAYAKFLKDAVDNEREECIVEKRLVLTAAAAIEELVNVVMEHESTLQGEKSKSDA